MVCDSQENAPRVITRDEVGLDSQKNDVEPALTGQYRVKTVAGEEVAVQPLFAVYLEFFEQNYRPALAAIITGVPAAKIEALAREIAAHPRVTKLSQAMGVNQYHHGDLNDRSMYLVCALTDNIGRLTGNIGSYAGNFRLPFFNGAGQYLAEDGPSAGLRYH